MKRLAAVLCLICAPALAQEIPAPRLDGPLVASAQGGVLRALDKLTGQVADLPMRVGETLSFGRIDVTLLDCRYPVSNPAGDAYAHINVEETGKRAPVFGGWIIASSPALHAMDHARYDVWALRCITS